jgi:hypothetical protein
MDMDMDMWRLARIAFVGVEEHPQASPSRVNAGMARSIPA